MIQKILKINLLCASFVTFLIIISFYKNEYLNYVHENSKLTLSDFKSFENLKKENLKVCEYPKLNPFDENILEYVEKPKNKTLECDWKEMIYSMSLAGYLIQEINPKDLGYDYCCYKVLSRLNDEKSIYSEMCHMIYQNETKIKDEFIAIFCEKNKTLKHVDYFSTVNIETLRKKKPFLNKNSMDGSYNVAIFGFDAVSHMNFQRTFPQSYSYFKTNLSAFFFNGLTKLGDGTFPNLIPTLTGNHVKDIKKFCWPTTTSYFDDCPFVWKEFSSNGFITSYGDDSRNSVVNYLYKGFYDPPTDFYFRPLTLGMNKNMYNTDIGYCYGPRLTFEIMLDYLKKTAFAFKDQSKEKYFQFIWETYLTHDELNYGHYGDEYLLQTLQWFHEGGYLEKTILILMSDHGMRYGEIRNTRQGKIEERMPLLSIVFPQQFRQQYTSALDFMKMNENRLISHFDIHATLQDLANITNIENENIQSRIDILKRSRGMSLFLPIPIDRNCVEADIPSHWCVCDSVNTIPSNSSLAHSSASAVITTINSLLAKYPQCEKLKLGKILDGVELFSFPKDEEEDQSSIEEVRIGVKTIPGNATFEATVSNKEGSFSIAGPKDAISRTNMYKNQSWCINDKELKKFCYCKVQH